MRHLPPPPRDPDGLVAEVFEEMGREFGVLAEALTLHHPIPPLLAAAWSSLRETVIAGRWVPRAAKEAMALAISDANRCPYCVDAHGMMLHALGEGDAERSLVAGREPPDDPRLARLAAWAAATGRAGDPRLEEPPFAASEEPEVVGTVCCFQYINRLATVLLGPSPLPAPARWMRGTAVRLAGRVLARSARQRPEPGSSLGRLPSAPTPGHLGWARRSPVILHVFSAFALVLEEAILPPAGRPILGPESQTLVRRVLATWNGEEPPLGSRWLEEPLEAAAEEDRPAVRLALLTALAPHRVEERAVGAFRARHPSDAALLALLAWSAHEAAKRISSWLPSPTP